MTTLESPVKYIQAPVAEVYTRLSDLNNLEKAKNKIPEDKIKNMECDRDSCRFTIDPAGEIEIRVVEREEPKTVKFGSEKSPIPFFLWIQLVPVSETETKIKLTIKAELNPFIKGMISKPLQDGINKLADVLAALPYQ